MTQSEAEEDGCDGESGDEEQSEEGHDEVEVVKGSGSRSSDTPILRLPERNEEDTRWTRAHGTKPDSVKNKLTVEDMARVCKHKELLWKEVAKNEQSSLVDHWLRDQVLLWTAGYGTKRAKTDARYFQAQLIGSVNFPWMSETHEMSAQSMSHTLVHQNLPEAGFGVTEIYEQEWEELGEESE
jgi:hypothetical protein